MTTINITNARQSLFQLVSDVNKGFNPVNIINNKGENASTYIGKRLEGHRRKQFI